MENERKEYLEHDVLPGLIDEKGEYLKQARDITEKITALEKERMELGFEIQGLKDRIIPLVEELTADMADEFEEVRSVDVKDGKIEVVIVDLIEEFKGRVRKARVEAKKKEKEISEMAAKERKKNKK